MGITDTPVATALRHYMHPLVFLLLIIPLGAASGFLGVTIVYLLGEAGVDPVTIAGCRGCASWLWSAISPLRF